MRITRMTAGARERLRRSFRPPKVRFLFIGESPPASGRFFYLGDSGLYRAMRDTFFAAMPGLRDSDFLTSFRDLGCYLVDLCEMPVDRLKQEPRRRACACGEVRLARTLRQHQPKIVITVVRSIALNARRAQQQADWSGTSIELPYPGRWRHHQIAFERALIPVLHREFMGLAIE